MSITKRVYKLPFLNKGEKDDKNNNQKRKWPYRKRGKKRGGVL